MLLQLVTCVISRVADTCLEGLLILISQSSVRRGRGEVGDGKREWERICAPQILH